MTNHSKYSPVTNTCVHKSVSSHISLCTPSVYVLACILCKFLGIGGHNSVRHHMAPDIGTAVLLRMDPKLGQTASKLLNLLFSSKQPCVLETQMMWGSQHSVTKESTDPECDAVSLGKQPSETSQCFHHQAHAFLLGLFNLWRWRHYESSKCWEILASRQRQIPEDLNPQQWKQQ